MTTSFLDSYLDHQSQRRPAAEAFRYGTGALTYAELHAQSTALAEQLQAMGIGAGDLVGVYLAKGLDMPVAVYGILMSGAGYVPLDVGAPVARTAHILDDCAVAVVISAPPHAKDIAAAADAAPTLRYAIGVPELSHGQLAGVGRKTAPDGDRDQSGRRPEDTAYIIFTSGSTGVPKGIVHTHASARAYAQMAAELYRLGPDDRMGNHSPLHFDMATFEFFAGVSRGACVVLVPDMVKKLPASLAKLIAAERLTVWYSVPFALVQLVERGGLDAHGFPDLRLVVFAGETMSPKHLHDLQVRFPHVSFSNIYGPAEVNCVTYHHLDPAPHDPARPVPIGVPCAHTRTRIDADGTLLVATPAMMAGYWRRPDLDAAAFVTVRSDAGPDERYYRTGDLVAQDASGVLHFQGRRDRQVKLRGFRVELGEVEQVLAQASGVSEAVAMVDADGTGLRVCVTAADGQAVTAAVVSDHARAHLPAHCQPSHIDVVDAFIRTSTGKIDRNALMKVIAL